MKNPLSYQMTEYDCGPTAFGNAISYLFKREEILPDIPKYIMQYCLDSYNRRGEAYKNGTSCHAMEFLSMWLNHFGEVRNFPVRCEMIYGEAVHIGQNSQIVSCLQQGGAVVSRVMLGCGHYVLLTGIEGEYVDLFDPYFRQRDFKKAGIEMIWGEEKKRNRRVHRDILNAEGKEDYNFSTISTRESVLIFNEKTRKTENNIEYII